MTTLQTLDLILCMALVLFYVYTAFGTLIWILEHFLELFAKEDNSERIQRIYCREYCRKHRLIYRYIRNYRRRKERQARYISDWVRHRLPRRVEEERRLRRGY